MQESQNSFTMLLTRRHQNCWRFPCLLETIYPLLISLQGTWLRYHMMCGMVVTNFVQRLFADSLAQYLPLCGILLKVHINLPQFLILCIEDKQISNKLFYSFWLGPFNSEISLFILHGNYLMWRYPRNANGRRELLGQIDELLTGVLMQLVIKMKYTSMIQQARCEQ